jgi:hypothetical protein
MNLTITQPPLATAHLGFSVFNPVSMQSFNLMALEKRKLEALDVFTSKWDVFSDLFAFSKTNKVPALLYTPHSPLHP